MTIDELKALITEHTQGTTLTLPSIDLKGPAAALIGTWLDGTLAVTELQREDHDDSVVVHGTLTVTGLSLTGLPVRGIEFALDPLDHDATLYLPLVVPADWTFAGSFPATDGSDLAALAFPVPPALLLTSAARPARDGYPALDPGLTFHASRVTDPEQLGALAALLRPRPGELSLTGPVVRRPAKGPGEEVRTDIALRSTPRPEGDFSASFYLWGGSRDDGTNGPAVTYGLRLAADLVLGQVGGTTISAPLPSGGGELALSADRLPGRLSPSDLAAWNGTGAAVHQLVDQEHFTLGDSVRLSGITATIDPAAFGKGGLAAALTQVTATVGTTPGTKWPIVGDDLALTGVGATLTVTDPLQDSRSAKVTGRGDFTVAGNIALHATAEIPPGTFRLSLDESTPAELRDVLQHFLPHAGLTGVPALTLKKFSGTTTPKKGSYAVDASVSSEWHIDIGAARIALTKAGLELARSEGASSGVVQEQADSGSRTTGTLSAEAELGPAGAGNGDDSVVKFSAAWTIPGAFKLDGTFPDLDLTRLLASLACQADVPLPDGLPQVSLLRPTVAIQVGNTPAGQPAAGKSYELTVSTTATFDAARLTFFGKAARKAEGGTLFAAAFWQQDWVWSPGKVSDWAPVLGFLDGITFAKSGLAVSSADGVTVDAGADTPDTLPATLDKGLTFFTELGLTGPLAPLKELFQDAGGIHLTARLTTPVEESEFTASIAEQKTREGFGGLTLSFRPANRMVSLQTSWNFKVPDVGDGSTLLQFVAGGALQGDAFYLSLILKPASGAAETAGQPAPHQLAYALRAPGYTLLTADPVPGGDGGLVHDATPRDAGASTYGASTYGLVRETANRLAGLTAPPSSDDLPAWKNAFGVEGFDVRYFYMQIGYGLETGLTLGAGGSVVIGEASLDLDIAAGFNPEPYVTVFHFGLDADHQGTGISVWDMLAVLLTPPDELAFLRQIVLHRLEICVVTVPGGWTNPVTQEVWKQGFYAKGDIDFFGNNWRFEVNVSNDGLYASSAVAQPLKLADVLTFSDASGTKGPQYLLDTRGIRTMSLPAKIFYLSGKLDLLGLSASVKAELGNAGFAFTIAADLLDILHGDMSCTLNSTGLKASAHVKLGFDVSIPRGVVLGGIPIPAGNLIGIHADGGFDLTVDGNGADLHLTASCSAYLGDVSLVPPFAFDQQFSISSWDDIVSWLQHNPEKLFASLGEGIWDALKDCATTTAAKLT